jgi:hypothetical protein
LQAGYYADPSLALLNIIRATEDYTATPFRFICLGVHVSIIPVVSFTGIRILSSVPTRVTVAPAFCVRAQWRLVAVDASLVIGGPEDPEPDDDDDDELDPEPAPDPEPPIDD